ncbi:alpha/beta hydrolase-fold protein [Aureimonas altamirensis]|uniref:alpha/beta hydrolase n=1 Tax=Aureimonas altamirensis TaxID=370622 RepID=UPI00203724A0|nr:alpha/beta hydrolase-fold protein [Aureimonas altamirensis]MCM2505404.1 alpha/beta hydrolase-fold protein [Aureimonas altamirensis]
MLRRDVLSTMIAAAAGLACRRTAYGASSMIPEAEDFTSPVDGAFHRLTHASVGQRPPGLYPLLLLLDGDTTFEPAIAHAEKLKRPIVVAGLGYGEDDRDVIVARRYYDLTSAAPDDAIPRAAGSPVPRTGGREAYATLLRETVVPRLARLYPIDPTRMTLFGHSLGGAFCLHQLYDGAGPFTAFAAADPSIWWNGGELWQRTLAWKGPARQGPTMVSITTSGRRGQRPGQSAVDARRTAELRAGPGGRAVAEHLSTLPRLAVSYEDFPEETHGSLKPVAVRLAVESTLVR